jgi:hypothetical protein
MPTMALDLLVRILQDTFQQLAPLVAPSAELATRIPELPFSAEEHFVDPNE